MSDITTAIPQIIFNVAQTFLVDKSFSPTGAQIGLTSIEVYFMFKPAGINNSSGMNYPGITLYLVPTIYGVPLITQDSLLNFARCEWNNIFTSSDASISTKFVFPSPIPVIAGQQYAIVLSYDGNETFFPWTASVGQWFVNTRTKYASQGGSVIGQFFQFTSPGNFTNNPLTAQTQAQYLSFWNSLNDTQMKFNVYAARYAIDGVPVNFSADVPLNTKIYGGNIREEWNVATQTLTYVFPSNCVEGIAFDLSQSVVQTFVGAQKVYQNTFAYPGGWANGSSVVTVSANSTQTITANSFYPNGVAFNWNTIYATDAGLKYITLLNNTDTNVRRIISIVSNTVIQVDEPTTFTNTTAQFMVTPVGTIDSILTSSPYGIKKGFVFLNSSAANSTVRFVNNTILDVNTFTGGTGYNNSDILYVVGFQNVANKTLGGYVAVANIVTNTSGGINAIYFSNLGCGFVNVSHIATVIANTGQLGNTSANSSAGSGATFVYDVGAVLETEMTSNKFVNCIVSNFNLDDAHLFGLFSVPIGIEATSRIDSLYYMNVDSAVYGGFAWYVRQTPLEFTATFTGLTPLVSNTPAAFVSYSNEFVTPYANGVVNDQVNAASGISNNIVLFIDTVATVNDDYLAVDLQTPSIEFGHYIINNSHYLEQTNQGNAWARHLTTLINFNQFAEDILFYMTAYKPINTDFKVYAKIQNMNDPEQFSLQDWTLLTPISGANLVSSTTDQTDYVELGFSFNPYEKLTTNSGPNNTVTISGSISTTNNSSTITGVNTAFQSVANIVANTMVRIYAPLFSENDYVVAMVNSVASDVSLTLDQVVTSNVNLGGNPALIANGLSMDILPYPHQAFHNIGNDNVARYYNASFMRYDGFNLVQVKVVMLSNTYSYIPQINNIRFLGASA